MKALEETNKAAVDNAKTEVRKRIQKKPAGWTDRKNARQIKRHEKEIEMLKTMEGDADKEAWLKKKQPKNRRVKAFDFF